MIEITENYNQSNYIFTYTVQSVPSITTDNWSISDVIITLNNLSATATVLDSRNFQITLNKSSNIFRDNINFSFRIIFEFQDNNTPNYIQNITADYIYWRGTYTPEKFIIQNTDDTNDITVRLEDGYSTHFLDVYYRVGTTPNGTYTKATTTTSITVPPLNNLYLYSDTMTAWAAADNSLYYDGAKIAFYDEGAFQNEGKIRFAGNIMALVKDGILRDYAFAGLFSHATMEYPPELPATTLAPHCYAYMFADEDGMGSGTINPPILPATTLANYCYENMFYNCWGTLTAAPTLPATTLAQGCYAGMFRGSDLATAPALPATTLAPNCYAAMFSYCSRLAQAPVLPATTLAQSCYAEMFSGCNSLLSTPILPATTLVNSCYNSMFADCQTLRTISSISATTTAQYCCADMFSGCINLIDAPASLPATTLAESCYRNMFSYCRSMTQAPELPATTLATNCYYEMFSGCSSLTTSPFLGASTLVEGCYRGLFKNCSSLNYITCLLTTNIPSTALVDWVSGVAANGTFVKHANCILGSGSIPSGWTQLTYVGQ